MSADYDMQRARAEEMYADDPLRYATEASDHGWSVITGACGGCGVCACHPGTCADGDYCNRCPVRVGQGLVRVKPGGPFHGPAWHHTTEPAWLPDGTPYLEWQWSPDDDVLLLRVPGGAA